MALTTVQPFEPCGPELSGQEPARPTTILVVDDSFVDRRLAGSIIEKQAGWKAAYAGNGVEALTALEAEPPTLVLTDLMMPQMDGLELVEVIRLKYPHLPVILMTAHGSEEIAIQALQKGAASYVPKKRLARDLAGNLDRVLAIAKVDHRQHRLLECLTRLESHFVLENDPALIAALVGHLQDHLTRLHLGDQTTRLRVGMALSEALLNGLYHGNLEIDPELRRANLREYYRIAAERRVQPPYEDRRLHVTAQVSRFEAIYAIRDEGPGFPPSKLADLSTPSHLCDSAGRGLLLIRTFMDDVSFNESGNQITMVKLRETRGAVSE